MFTDAEVANLARVLIAGRLRTERGYFRGLNPWQREFILHVNLNLKSVIIAARRTGKTFTFAFLACLILIKGKTAILALPNARSVEGVILDEIEKMLHVLERDVPILFSKEREKARDRTWSGGGRLLSLSIRSINDGYGGSFVLIDESQFMEPEEVLPTFEPFVNPFLAIGEGRIVLTGRGGPSQSLIHAAGRMEHNPYATGIFDDVYLGTKYPELQPEFDQAKGMPLYESHYGCKPIPDEGNYLLPSIESVYEYTPAARYRYWGIDTAGGVGRDATVCCQLEVDDGHLIWADHYEAKYGTTHEQAEGIFKFIDDQMRFIDHCMIETNFNHGLHDELKKNYMHDIKGQKIGLDMKVTAVKALQVLNKDGKLIIPDVKVRQELEGLIFSVKPNGNWEFKLAHSDYLSALIMAFLATPQMTFSM